MGKEIIRGYHIFLPKGWKRAAIYIVFPFLIMGVCILAGRSLSMAVPVLLFGGSCILWVDGIIYYLIFGGFADKDSRHMEYIKSSGRGVMLYHRGLVTDAARRLCSIILIFLTTAVIVSGPPDTRTAILLAGAFSITCLTVFIASFIIGFLQSFLWIFLILGILNIGYSTAVILFSIIVTSGVNAGLSAGIIALVIVFTVLLIRGQISFLIKRMKGWYYDNQTEDRS